MCGGVAKVYGSRSDSTTSTTSSLKTTRATQHRDTLSSILGVFQKCATAALFHSCGSNRDLNPAVNRPSSF